MDREAQIAEVRARVGALCNSGPELVGECMLRIMRIDAAPHSLSYELARKRIFLEMAERRVAIDQEALELCKPWPELIGLQHIISHQIRHGQRLIAEGDQIIAKVRDRLALEESPNQSPGDA